MLKYAAIARVTIASQAAYLAELLLRTVFLALILYIFVQLWTAVGGDLRFLIWYLVVTESVIMSRPRLTLTVDQEVRNGDVAYQLIRPYDYVLFRLAAYLGERALRFATTLAAGALVALILVGPPDLEPLSLVAAFVLLVVSALVDFFGAMAIGLCAFWLEDTQPLTLLYDRAIMLLGGLLLPLELLPGWLESILRALPFQLMLYAPARMAVSHDLAPLAGALLGLVATLACAFALVRFVFSIAERRLHANGG